jgi:hypothetical protein
MHSQGVKQATLQFATILNNFPVVSSVIGLVQLKPKFESALDNLDRNETIKIEMPMKALFNLGLIFFLSSWMFGCGGSDSNGGNSTNGDSSPSVEETTQRVGFEILEFQSPNFIRAWIGSDITREEFEALELPVGWMKNQPREGEPDASVFFHSPGTTTEGEFLEIDFLGFHWWHSATVIQSNIALDEQGLLSGSTVNKYHEVTYNAGRTIAVLFSPEDDPYVRISRDANRTSGQPSIPDFWVLVEYTTQEDIVIQLPEETLVIRTDNEDSFQGPAPELEFVR